MDLPVVSPWAEGAQLSFRPVEGRVLRVLSSGAELDWPSSRGSPYRASMHCDCKGRSPDNACGEGKPYEVSELEDHWSQRSFKIDPVATFLKARNGP